MGLKSLETFLSGMSFVIYVPRSLLKENDSKHSVLVLFNIAHRCFPTQTHQQCGRGDSAANNT